MATRKRIVKFDMLLLLLLLLLLFLSFPASKNQMQNKKTKLEGVELGFDYFVL